MHTRRLAILASLAVAPCIPAQTVAARYVADTELIAFAGSSRSTLPRGTTLDSGTTWLSAASPAGRSGAVTQVTFAHSDLTGTRIQINENSNVTEPGLSCGVGSHETLLVLTSTAPVAARVRVVYGSLSTLWPQHASSRARVDIGDDGSFELEGALGSQVDTEQVVTIPPGGLRIRTITENGVEHPPGPQSRSQVISNLQLIVTPESNCTPSGGGGACLFAASPQLAGQMTFRHSLLLHTQAFGPAQGLFTLVGTQSIAVPIPAAPCTLLVAPLVVLPSQLDPLGAGVLELPIPRSFAGQVLFQQVIVGGLLPPLTATGAVTLQCQ